MRVVWVTLLLCSTVLAGCSEPPAPDEAPDDLGAIDEQIEATDTTGVIRGVVVDNAIVPVVGANITIASLQRTTQSDANGAFGFGDIEPGTYFLIVEKVGFNSTQAAVNVVAGVDKPAVVKVLLARNPSSVPYIVPTHYLGFLACGFAVFLTSVGCTITGGLADLTQSTSIWTHVFDSDRIMWTQGELVWEHNQPAGGMLIWEITRRTNSHIGYRETTTSPALAYVPPEVFEENPNEIVENGVAYRYFGGPHPSCHGIFGFGCGVTIDQAAEAFVHDFYNLVPPEGWRYTSDGDPVVPS